MTRKQRVEFRFAIGYSIERFLVFTEVSATPASPLPGLRQDGGRVRPGFQTFPSPSVIDNRGQVSVGRGAGLGVAFSAPEWRQPHSTDKTRKCGVDVTAWWRKHLARRVPGLYAGRLGELEIHLLPAHQRIDRTPVRRTNRRF